MKELKIEVILTSNNQISKEKYLAIEDNNCLSYLENDIKVCLYIGNIIRMTKREKR